MILLSPSQTIVHQSMYKHDVIIENTTMRKILQKLPENIKIHIMNDGNNIV